MRKILFIILAVSTVAQANTIKKFQRKLKKELKREVFINSTLIRNKDRCSTEMLRSWFDWWKQVKKPYKAQYLNKLEKLSKINILRSNKVQTITGSYSSVYLVKKICTGGRLGQNCKTLDSKHLKLQKEIKITGSKPEFELQIGDSADIYLEFTEDSASSKRYDTFSIKSFKDLNRDPSLLKRYILFGNVTQLIRPGTDNSVKTNCSYPRLDQIISRLK